MVDVRQSQQYANYLRTIGWTVERVEGINYFVRKFPLIGSVLKVQRPEKVDFKAIDRLCRKYRVFQIIIEPKLGSDIGSAAHRSIVDRGFKLSKSPYLPSKTLQIDLTQSQKTILSHFKKDARAAVRKVYDPESSRGGSGDFIKEYSTPNDIRMWRSAWKNSVKFTRYVPSADQLINLRKSFPDNNSLFLASHNISGSIIGGALFTASSHERSNYISYYWYAFTNKEGRTSLSQYSLLWHGILWAKRMGCKVFDFEGIYDPRFPNKSWLGFTHFKKSFGGAEVLYPGCYTHFRISLQPNSP
jgi:lipid II:glycine glycyltransferase (peptidoglycan interpeptide bridge formation enzyme)